MPGACWPAIGAKLVLSLIRNARLLLLKKSSAATSSRGSHWPSRPSGVCAFLDADIALHAKALRACHREYRRSIKHPPNKASYGGLRTMHARTIRYRSLRFAVALAMCAGLAPVTVRAQAG